MNGMTLLPPAPDVCQVCAAKHDEAMPHNQTSLYYKYWFFGQHGRWPTWKDAMSHCSENVKAAWTEALRRRGIDLE